MIRFLPLFVALLGALVVPLAAQTDAPAPPAGEDPEAPARAAVLELAGAFSNDGYKIRDGYYFGELEPGKSVVLEVNLFAGNEYWFCASALAPARKISVELFDESGAPVEQQTYQDVATAAAGVVAEESGKYLARVTLVEGDKAAFAFLYCYK